MKESLKLPLVESSGAEVPEPVIITTIIGLNELASTNPEVFRHLYSHVVLESSLPPSSAQVLEEIGLMSNGLIHGSVRAIVASGVRYDMGKPVIKNPLSRENKIESGAEVDAAVASLDLDELLAISVSSTVGSFGPLINGYEKIADFVDADGNPTEILKISVARAVGKLVS